MALLQRVVFTVVLSSAVASIIRSEDDSVQNDGSDPLTFTSQDSDDSSQASTSTVFCAPGPLVPTSEDTPTGGFALPSASTPPFAGIVRTPISQVTRNAASITEDQWPADFCINLDISTPSFDDSPGDSASFQQGPHQRSFALIGGHPGTCEGIEVTLRSQTSWTYVGFPPHKVYTKTNYLDFGVSCNAGESDAMVSLANPYEDGGSQQKFAFCYSTNTHQAKIYVGGALKTTEIKTWTFDRKGSISIFSAKHELNNHIMSGATLNSFQITTQDGIGSGCDRPAWKTCGVKICVGFKETEPCGCVPCPGEEGLDKSVDFFPPGCQTAKLTWGHETMTMRSMVFNNIKPGLEYANTMAGVTFYSDSACATVVKKHVGSFAAIMSNTRPTYVTNAVVYKSFRMMWCEDAQC